MNNPSFSIIIPLYNKQDSIVRTLKAVLAQTYGSYEVIVVNDGSTDASREYVENVKDSRIRLIDKPNGGVSSARNVGIRAARHEWIAFLDGDDCWHPGYLEHLCELNARYPEASVLTVGWDDDIHTERNPYVEEGYLENYFRISLKGFIFFTSSIAAKKSSLEEAGLFDESLSYGEDLDLWCRLARKFRIAYSPKRLTLYMTQAENRACEVKRLKIGRHYAYVLSLKEIHGRWERRFARMLIRDCLMHCLAYKDYKSLKAMMVRHGYPEILMDLIVLNLQRVPKKIRRILQQKRVSSSTTF